MQIDTIPLSLPFRLSQVNVTVIRANGKVALVDTGLDTPQARQEMSAGLGSIGLEPADIDTVFVTHYHGDHWCLAPWYQSMGATVIMPSEDHRLLQRWLERPQYDREVVALYAARGVPEALLDTVGKAMAGIRRMSPLMHADETVEDTQIIGLCDEPFQVLVTPGHSPGHACLQHIPSRTLLCGDHVLPEITPNITPSFAAPESDPLTDYRASLRRLRGRGFSVAHPAHGPIIDDLDARIDVLLAHHDEREAMTLDQLAHGPKTVFEVCTGLFDLARLDGWETLMALGETTAHLKRLQNNGEVTLSDEQPPRYGPV